MVKGEEIGGEHRIDAFAPLKAASGIFKRKPHLDEAAFTRLIDVRAIEGSGTNACDRI